MKSKVFILSLFFLTQSIFSQNLMNCSTSNGSLINEEDYSHSIDPIYLANFEPVVLNIFFWGINKSSSPNVPTINEQTVLQNVAYINKEFNQFNIFFKYIGYDNTSFNSDIHYSGSSIHSIKSYAKNNGHVIENSFNFYVPRKFDLGGGQASGTPSRFLGVSENNFQNVTYTILHELGHSLGLLHTEHEWDNSSICERVTRNSADIAYNADCAGDFVVDTAAKPYFLGVGGTSNEIDIDITTCTYIGSGTDCGGTPYQIFEDDVRNYMSKGYPPYPNSGCHDRFSIGQKIRMLETIELDSELIVVNQKLFPAITTIASLYEPYDGSYDLGGSFPNPPTFQPGFDYEFVDCSCSSIPLNCDLPVLYEETSFQDLGTIYGTISCDENNYTSIVHPNHTAIKIIQLDDPQPRRCWDNNGTGPQPIGGTIIRFKDDLFNLNISREQIDAKMIIDESYFRSLEKGLYKIEIYYDNGTIDERMIYVRN